jgi:pyruvate, orthophosphate dikinase
VRDRSSQGAQRLAGRRRRQGVFDPDHAVEWATPARRSSSSGVETSPDDFHGMAAAKGILTARGGATSHAAVVARQIGKPCVAGCEELTSTTPATRGHRDRA